MKTTAYRTAGMGFFVLLFTLLYTSVSMAGISSVVRGGTQPDPANCAPAVDASPLADGTTAYCDRDYVWAGVAGTAVEGAEYVIVANDDKDIGDYSLTVTVDISGTLYLLWNDLITADTGFPQWATDLGFTDTGENITLTTGAADPAFSVYSLAVTNGDVTLYGANNSNSAIYSVAFVENPQVDIAVGVDANPASVLAGSGEGNLVVTYTVENLGPDTANNIVVNLSSTGDDDVSVVSAPVPGGSSILGDDWMITTLAPAASLELVATLTVGVNQTSGENVIVWTATVTAVDEEDANAGNDTASANTTVTSAADLVTSFDTSVTFTNGDSDAVMATLTCNTGLPLEQSFEISEGSPVNFVVTDLPFTTPGTSCEITIDGVDTAYSVEGSANGGAAAASCVYEVGGFANDGANDCVFTATPMPTTITVESTFIGAEDPSIDTTFETTLTCTNVSPDTGSSFITADTSSGVSPLVVDWYAAPGETASCTAVMVPESSAVEGSECAFTFVLGDEEAGCDVVGTVFFEGIPTLSQYGLAIMALLMLGVGFVGMRRFV